MPAPALETPHLRLLVALDDEGTLHAAARRLHVTPSALSQQLRELETRLGGPLFYRQWRRLSITPAGRRLTDAARTLLGDLAIVEAEARGLLAGASGTIRITTACHQSYRWLGTVLREYASTHPAIEITIVPEATTAPSAFLADHKVDVALVPSEIRLSERIRTEPLFRDELVALVGRDHPWAGRRRRVPFAAFADEHVWSDADAFKRDTALARAFAAAGDVQPRKVSIVPVDGPVALEMARANLGITILPRWSVEPVLQGSLHPVSLGDAGIWLDWSIATRAEPVSAPLAAFLDVLRAHHPRARRRASTRSSPRGPRGTRRVLGPR